MAEITITSTMSPKSIILCIFSYFWKSPNISCIFCSVCESYDFLVCSISSRIHYLYSAIFLRESALRSGNFMVLLAIRSISSKVIFCDVSTIKIASFALSHSDSTYGHIASCSSINSNYFCCGLARKSKSASLAAKWGLNISRICSKCTSIFSYYSRSCLMRYSLCALVSVFSKP